MSLAAGRIGSLPLPRCSPDCTSTASRTG